MSGASTAYEGEAGLALARRYEAVSARTCTGRWRT